MLVKPVQHYYIKHTHVQKKIQQQYCKAQKDLYTPLRRPYYWQDLPTIQDGANCTYRYVFLTCWTSFYFTTLPYPHIRQHTPYAPESDYRSVKENRNKEDKEGSDATSKILSPEPFSPADICQGSGPAALQAAQQGRRVTELKVGSITGLKALKLLMQKQHAGKEWYQLLLKTSIRKGRYRVSIT